MAFGCLFVNMHLQQRSHERFRDWICFKQPSKQLKDYPIFLHVSFLEKEQKTLEISQRQPFTEISTTSDSTLRRKTGGRNIHVKHIRNI